MYLFQSERLGFRNWKPEDLDPFAEMCADPVVMEFFPNTATREQTQQLIERLDQCYQKNGYTYFAIELLEAQSFIGFIGIMLQDYGAGWEPFVDIGWRLQPSAWGNGYATEGARRCLKFGFEEVGLDEIFAVAPELNLRSKNVMQKIGMQKIKTFPHPKIPATSNLQQCALFQMKKNEFKIFK